MGKHMHGMNPVQAADQAIDAVIRLAKDCGIPENWGQVTEYPKTHMGQGWYEGKSSGPIQSDDDGKVSDLPVDAAKEILRDCMYDPMERKTSNGYRQNVWGAAPEMGRKTHGYEERDQVLGRQPMSR